MIYVTVMRLASFFISQKSKALILSDSHVKLQCISKIYQMANVLTSGVLISAAF